MGLELPPRARRVGLLTAGSAGLLLLGACSAEDQDQIRRLAMPEPITDRAPYIYDLWQGAWIAAILVGVLVWGLIGWAAFKYRRRADDEIPVQTRYNLPIEILYTVAPIVVVLVFFYYTVTVQNDVLAPAGGEDGEADHNITVVGQQWSWTFNYIDEEGVGDVYDRGTPAHLPQLWLVEDQTVTFTLHSPDVIHSFWVPSFYFKLDVIPGRDQSFSLTPTEQGEFAGRQRRPGHIVRGQPRRPTVGLEGAAVVHPERPVDPGDQLLLDALPAAPEDGEQVGIDRDAGPFHPGGGGHVPATQQGPRQVDPRQHGRQ